MIDIVRGRLASWNNKHLSIGGRIILLKSVLSALPVYYLSFFKAPTCIILKLESMFKNFPWDGDLKRKKIHWIQWDKIYRDKAKGGLGIKNLKAFNLALVGKWKWRLFTKKNMLWVRILESKYGVSCFGGSR